jgi:aminoglycoside phosphotransferase (APT) family kinase protein
LVLESFPAGRRESVRSALKAAFGTTPVTFLTQDRTGASAAIHRIEVGGRPYLLRVDSALRDNVRDPVRSYPCMQAAAQAGIAPALHYADGAAGVAIMDFIVGRPLKDYPGGPEELSRALGELAAKLQATPVFPSIGDYPSVIGGMFDDVLASKLYADGLLDSHRAGFERIREAYPWDEAGLVSSHNDSHPGNILFDGARLWLIDWETAYRNDPLADIAIMTMYVANTPELQEVLIRSWLGRPSDEVLRARLVLMRMLVRLFYATANAFYVATARPDLRETDLAAPTPAEFRAALDEGRLIANTFETQRVGGKVAFRSFIDGLASPAFAEALATVKG